MVPNERNYDGLYPSWQEHVPKPEPLTSIQSHVVMCK